jgi:hypothetical protein
MARSTGGPYQQDREYDEAYPTPTKKAHHAGAYQTNWSRGHEIRAILLKSEVGTVRG